MKPHLANANFCMSYVKGAARSHTILCLLAMWYSDTWPVRELFPDVLQSFRAINVCFPNQYESVLTVALDNAALSQRGSLRKEHDVICWVAKLQGLSESSGLSPMEILRKWNSRSTSRGAVRGGKLNCVVNVLGHCSPTIISSLAGLASTLGGDTLPFNDGVCANNHG